MVLVQLPKEVPWNLSFTVQIFCSFTSKPCCLTQEMWRGTSELHNACES